MSVHFFVLVNFRRLSSEHKKYTKTAAVLKSRLSVISTNAESKFRQSLHVENDTNAWEAGPYVETQFAKCISYDTKFQIFDRKIEEVDDQNIKGTDAKRLTTVQTSTTTFPSTFYYVLPYLRNDERITTTTTTTRHLLQLLLLQSTPAITYIILITNY